MKRHSLTHGLKLTLMVATVFSIAHGARAAEQGPGQKAVAEAARDGKFAFILFYRQNDAATQSMYQTLKTELAEHANATCVSVRITDAAEANLVERFDATRTPLPAVMSVAPNDAVTGVFIQNLTQKQIQTAIVTPGQATCMKALQDQKLVLLCIQRSKEAPIPDGVAQFQADELFRDRTQLVTIQAGDPAEARFVTQFNVPTNTATTVTAFMAPPGVLLGTYDSNVTHAALAQRLAAAGKCCDDPNCRHHRAEKKSGQRR